MDEHSNNGKSEGYRLAEPPAEQPKRTYKLWISDLSISQPVFITMIVIAALVVGGYAFSKMGLDLLPDTSLPIVVVQTIYPGADPSEIERTVTKPIEDQVASINNIDTIKSTSMDSASMVVIQFTMETDGKAAADEVRNKVNVIRNNLPADTKEPIISRVDPNAAVVIGFAVSDRTGKLSSEELRTLVDDTLKQRIQKVDGVAGLNVVGGLVREVHIDLHLNRLKAYAVPPQLVIQAIKSDNLDIPGGRVKSDTAEQLVRTAGQVHSVDELREMPIPGRQGPTVKVKDLADVTESHQEVRSISRFNGKESIVAEVRKQSGSNTIQVVDGVRRELDQIRKDYPDLSLEVTTDQSTFTRDSVQDVEISIILGGILAGLVVFLFFRNLRNTIITVAGLPVIIFATFGFMYLFGITLNIVTLMALSLSVGMLIDDAIVVRENIFRFMERGHDRKRAAGEATAQIGLAVFAVTSTIIAVFFPITFATGLIGKFIRFFGMTVVIAVLVSLFEAFTFGPMLSSLFAQKMDVEGTSSRKPSLFLRSFQALDRGYRALLAWSLRHRLAVVGVGVLALGTSLWTVTMMTTSFLPSTDQGEINMSVEMPPSSRLEDTDRLTAEIEKIVQADPEVDRVYVSVGGANGAVDSATIHVNMKERGKSERFISRTRPQVEKLLVAGTRVNFQKTSLMDVLAGGMAAGSLQSRPLQYSVQGSNMDDLDRVSADLAEKLKQVPGLTDVGRSYKQGAPEQVIRLDRNRANDLGVSTASLGSTMRVLFNGDQAGSFRAADKDIDIYVRLAEGDRNSTDEILTMPVMTSKGSQIPLSNVAQVDSSTSASQIDRQDRQRQIMVGAGYSGRDTGKVFAAAKKIVDGMQLPKGVTIKPMGQLKFMNDAISMLLTVLAFSVFFIYMILASQFGSFIHPFTIMLALPFSIVGAMLALFAGRFSLDMLGMIGVILLMGLVTKNSILLVEFVNQLKRQGLSTSDAILKAGPTRLRPILMTTLAMILGMVPTAVGFGAGGEFRQPMGVSVIGGVITSTVLTLIIVPVAYSLIDDATRFLTRKKDRRDDEALSQSHEGTKDTKKGAYI